MLNQPRHSHSRNHDARFSPFPSVSRTPRRPFSRRTFVARSAVSPLISLAYLASLSTQDISPMAVSMTRLGDQTNRGSIFPSLKFPDTSALTRDYLRSIEKFANSQYTEITPSSFSFSFSYIYLCIAPRNFQTAWRSHEWFVSPIRRITKYATIISPARHEVFFPEKRNMKSHADRIKLSDAYAVRLYLIVTLFYLRYFVFH